METGTFRDKVKRTTKKVVRFVVIILLIGGAIAFSFFYWAVYDEGYMTGRIIRVSKKGVMFKTIEGKLNIETFGALKGASPIAESYDFSVEKGDDELLKQLEAAALKGELVNLHYVKRYATFPWRGDTRIFATKVERDVNPGTPPQPSTPPVDHNQ
jgi:hypothetical protein